MDIKINPYNNISPINFQAKLNISNIKDDKPYWIAVAEEFEKQTSEYPEDSFILEQEETFMPDSNLTMRSYNKKEDYTSQKEFMFYNETKEKLGEDVKNAARNLAQLFKFCIKKGSYQKLFDDNKVNGIKETSPDGGEIYISPDDILNICNEGTNSAHKTLLKGTIFEFERGIGSSIEEDL